MDQGESRPARVLGATARGLLVALLVVAPLPFGSVRPTAAAVIQLSVAVALLLWVGRLAFGGETALPSTRPGTLALALFLTLVGIQLLNLPQGLMNLLSPATAEIYRDLQSSGGAALAGVDFPWTLSLAPADTGEALRRLLATVGVFFLVASLFRGRRRLALLAGALAAIGTFEAAYGMIEALSGRQQIFGYVKKYYTDVVTGTYINQNHFAGLMEFCLPVTLGLLLSRRSAGEGAGSWREKLGRLSTRRASVNLFLGLALLVMLLGLALSLSRSGISFGLLGLCVVGLGYTLRKRGGRGILTTAMVVLAALGFLILGSMEKVGGEFSRLGQDMETSGNRFDAWRDSFVAVREHPVAGTGLGSFEAAFPLFRSPDISLRYDHAHNDLLQAFMETGVLGGLLLLAALGAGAGLIIRRLREAEGPELALRLGFAGAVLALSLHSLTDFNLRIPANALLYAACFGAALALPSGSTKGQQNATAVIPFPEDQLAEPADD